jgi:poly(A) polymerase
MEALGKLLDTEDAADTLIRVRARIHEDPITILRIATAIAESRGQWPVDAVTSACRDSVALLGQAPGAQVVAELEQTLLGRDVDEALQWLHVVGAVALFLPELAATVDLVQEAGRKHKDVWEHTKQVVKQSVRRPEVRWAALLHDIGKVPTRTFTSKGVHFHGHAEVGARMFDRIARRLPFEHSLRRTIRFLIRHHLRSAQYETSWTDSAVRRFSREMDPYLIDLLDLSRADITSKRPGRRRFLLRQIAELKTRIDTLRELDAQVPPLPSGLGNAIMSHFGLPPSKRIGELKQALEQAVERGELEERRDDAYYLDWLERSGLVPAKP